MMVRMDPYEPMDYAENAERVSWIRKLCKGAGLERRIKGVPYELFGAEDWDSLVNRLDLECSLLPRSMRATMAIRNALNVPTVKYGEPAGPGLVERRAVLASWWGVTSRTVDRIETAGARLLDHRLSARLGGDALEEMTLDLYVLNLEFERYGIEKGLSREAVAALNDAWRRIDAEASAR